MKKIMIALMVMLFGIVTVNAGSSPVIAGHQMIPGPNFVTGPMYPVTSASYTTAWGIYTNVTNFIRTADLPPYHTSWNGRELILDLWEYDVPPNANDKVVGHRAIFKGRQVQSIYVHTRFMLNGVALDTVGDPTGELYTQARLTTTAGDSNLSSGQFYTYRMTVD